MRRGLVACVGVVGCCWAGGTAWADGPGVGTPAIVALGDSAISGEAGRWAGNTNDSSSKVDALGASAYSDAAGGEAIRGCHRSQSAEVHIGGGVLSGRGAGDRANKAGDAHRLSTRLRVVTSLARVLSRLPPLWSRSHRRRGGLVRAAGAPPDRRA